MPHFYLRVTSSDKVKVIISVSKKISKKAVVRNTVKRRVRAIMWELLKNLKPGTYLIVAKPGAEKIRGQNLKDELAELFKKV